MNRFILFMLMIATLQFSCSIDASARTRHGSHAKSAAVKHTHKSSGKHRSVASKHSRKSAKKSSSRNYRENTFSSDYVVFRSSGVRLRKPAGFEKANTFDGFGQSETQSSVMVLSIPGPFSKATESFTREQMTARGWTLLSREEVKIDGLPGILVNFEQPSGDNRYLKWLIAFGDDIKTTMVIAAFPKKLEEKLSARMKSTVLSARRDESAALEAGADLPFTLTPSKKLKLTTGVTRSLTYTRYGIIPVKSAKDPLFIAVPSIEKVVTENRKEFAERRLLETAHMKQLSIKSTNKINIDGLEGYESLAEAMDNESGTPLVCYQVMLFDNASYILMQGFVGTGGRDEYLPEFKAMTRSLKKKLP